MVDEGITYDALNRLASATATSLSWGQSYTYDGFGNLTDQTVTAGSAPAFQTSYDASTNHVWGMDANGNMPGYNYDVENRIKTPTGYPPPFEYFYAPGNKRVWRGVWTTDPDSGITSLTTDEVTFWSVTGQKLATYQIQVGTNTLQMAQTGTNYYFWSKLIKNAGGYVVADRLGSIGKFYPWGQEKPSATTNGTEKFTGYFRDAETGLDYADQRYHNPGTGRFMTADPYSASGGPADPGSWNRYAYTRGDPVNRIDRTGLDDCSAHRDAYACPYTLDSGGGGGDDGCYIDDFVENPECYDPPPPQNPTPTPPPQPQPPTCGLDFFSTFGLVSGGEEDAVSVLLGENSWNYMGTNQYYPGQKYGHGTGAVIGVSNVSLEDDYMADVILNRVSQWGGTLSSQASNPRQFNGYPNGSAMFTADMSTSADTTQCSDLMVAFGALRSQEIGPELNTSILFWGGVINPRTNTSISIPAGDFMVADTIFGATQVYR